MGAGLLGVVIRSHQKRPQPAQRVVIFEGPIHVRDVFLHRVVDAVGVLLRARSAGKLLELERRDRCIMLARFARTLRGSFAHRDELGPRWATIKVVGKRRGLLMSSAQP